MQLSDTTLQLLKNYAAINSNIVIQPGNKLKTISEAKNILASADIAEQFPQQLGIYDLNEFLGVLSLVDKPTLKFSDDYIVVSDSSGRSNIKYFLSDPEILTTSNKDIELPSCEVSFTLDASTLQRVKRAASTLGHSSLSIEPDNGSIRLSVVDPDNSTSNVFSIYVDGEYPEEASFNFNVNIDNFKMIPGDYNVKISSKLISQFVNKETDVIYFIALEKTSTYGV
jgi:hypothetical protein